MTILQATRRLSFGALLIAAALLAGCGGTAVKGTYASDHGAMSIRFDSGKAWITTLAGTVETAYEVDGDKILLKSPQGNLVLTRNGDGSLSGPMGALSKTTERGRPLSGTYAMSNGRGGIAAITFDAGRAYVHFRSTPTGAAGQLTTSYALRGDQVVVKAPRGGGDDLVLTRNADGSLRDSTGQTLRKQGS